MTVIDTVDAEMQMLMDKAAARDDLLLICAREAAEQKSLRFAAHQSASRRRDAIAQLRRTYSVAQIAGWLGTSENAVYKALEEWCREWRGTPWKATQYADQRWAKL